MKKQGNASGVSAFPADIVLPDGSLNGKWALRSEVLYRGMNGQAVERFYMSASPQSYIFKPLTNSGQWGQEKWVYENVLPAFPPLYPKMLAESADPDTGRHWIIFEDIGNLHHMFSEAAALKLVESVAWWHALPTDRWTEFPLKGPKPQVEEMAAELLRNEPGMKQLLAKLSVAVPEAIWELIRDILEREPSSTTPRVLCHGDLHLGNYAQVDGRIVVLDWEHAHLSSPYWDLYHIIDMSHPSFPKTVTSSVRTGILLAYREQSRSFAHRSESEEEFIRGYAQFACVFSLWMLSLIAGDLARGAAKWPQEQLERQLQEAMASLNQCAELL
ncbi:hypothetical protein PAECIP111893_03575 [Paenibacillus plantiphilus]|uniref:Aminoglycoside phosphotransferase domain-containing protein n=1 Tax=Paenibacillus plantiphilus TaxID=2905650 RepID=A0ABN8GP50_9BACL|nr:aminoglycoside phosphotransferase family protein [Paenibacillus plantiphilus]CAH1212654.1 hypothetical protein PAECIP111893_03575 [Paenibacillus plantiphilus]